MSMVEQSESNEIFVSEVKAKKLMITGSARVSNVAFPIPMDLFTMGSLIFGIQNKIPSDLLYPTILILPHPTPKTYIFGQLSSRPFH